MKKILSILFAGCGAMFRVLMRKKNRIKPDFQDDLFQLFDDAVDEIYELKAELSASGGIDYELARGEIGDAMAFLAAMARSCNRKIRESKQNVGKLG
jgi:NTP pyrophosphatase (non-canonical NTP hydrolase)